jgi:hypothetical protein
MPINEEIEKILRDDIDSFRVKYCCYQNIGECDQVCYQKQWASYILTKDQMSHLTSGYCPSHLEEIIQKQNERKVKRLL